MVPMPKLTPSRYRVSISYTFRPDICDPLKMWRYVALSRKCLDRLSEIMMLVLRINFLDDYQIQKENFLVGLLILMDMRYWRGHLYSRLLNSTFFRFLKFVFQKYPLNVRKVAIINLDSTMEKGVNLCLSILPEKIRSRVSIL